MEGSVDELVNLIQIEAVPGDFNGDGRTNLEDHAVYTDCLTGPGVKPDPSCGSLDSNGDGSIDMADFAVLQAGFSAP